MLLGQIGSVDDRFQFGEDDLFSFPISKALNQFRGFRGQLIMDF